MRTAFVLSGGGSLGASQAGMVQALYERGVRPDLLVGTSARAVNAGLIASRPPTPQTAADLQRVWRGLGRSDVFPANPVVAGLGILGLRAHCVSDIGCLPPSLLAVRATQKSRRTRSGSWIHARPAPWPASATRSRTSASTRSRPRGAVSDRLPRRRRRRSLAAASLHR
jgi:hypothetical protein